MKLEDVCKILQRNIALLSSSIEKIITKERKIKHFVKTLSWGINVALLYTPYVLIMENLTIYIALSNAKL